MSRQTATTMAAICTSFLTAWLALAGVATAGPQPEASAEIALLSKYVWRGIVLTDGLVLQPSASFAIGGLELGVWGNVDQNDLGERSGRLSEVDYTAGFTYGAGPLALTLGALHYSYPDGGRAATTEACLSVGVGVLLSPALHVHRDIDVADGTYATFGVEHAVPIGGAGLTLAATVGWGDDAHNAFYYGVAGEKLADATIVLSSSIGLTPIVSLTPMVGYSTLLASEIRDAAPDPDSFVVGVFLRAGF